jgi:hypothetical protein
LGKEGSADETDDATSKRREIDASRCGMKGIPLAEGGDTVHDTSLPEVVKGVA